MLNQGAELKAKREKAGLSCKQVGDAVARSHEWVRLVEIGRRSITPVAFAIVIEAINRLSLYRRMERRQRQNLVDDLRLPRHIRTKRPSVPRREARA